MFCRSAGGVSHSARADQRGGRFRGAASRGWWFGFGYHLIGLYWITEAILFEAARFWWLVPLAVPALAAVLAVFIAIPAWIAWFVDARERRSRGGRAAQVLTLAGDGCWGTWRGSSSRPDFPGTLSAASGLFRAGLAT